MDENSRKNMKHLIKMFERIDTEGEHAADIREISQMTEEAFNTALGIILLFSFSHLFIAKEM